MGDQRNALMDIYRLMGNRIVPNWGSSKPIEEWEGVEVNQNGRIFFINISYLNVLEGNTYLIKDFFVDIRFWSSFFGQKLI